MFEFMQNAYAEPDCDLIVLVQTLDILHNMDFYISQLFPSVKGLVAISDVYCQKLVRYNNNNNYYYYYSSNVVTSQMLVNGPRCESSSFVFIYSNPSRMSL